MGREVSGPGRWPDFLYIGTARAGSSWLHQVLLEHPEVAMPAPKEIQYFDNHYNLGPDWYRAFFARAGRRITGEIWHDYFLDPVVADRVWEHCPDVRLIATLREPVDRAISRLGWSRANENVRDLALADFALRPDIAREADYLPNLKPFFERFPRDKILMLFYDDLVSAPDAVAATVFRFLGVDATYCPPSVSQRVGEVRAARSAGINNLVRAGVRLARRAGIATDWRVKRNPVVNAVLYGAKNARDGIVATTADRARIRARYEPQYDELEALIGRRLPAAWRAPVD